MTPAAQPRLASTRPPLPAAGPRAPPSAAADTDCGTPAQTDSQLRGYIRYRQSFNKQHIKLELFGLGLSIALCFFVPIVPDCVAWGTTFQGTTYNTQRHDDETHQTYEVESDTSRFHQAQEQLENRTFGMESREDFWGHGCLEYGDRGFAMAGWWCLPNLIGCAAGLCVALSHWRLVGRSVDRYDWGMSCSEKYSNWAKNTVEVQVRDPQNSIFQLYYSPDSATLIDTVSQSSAPTTRGTEAATAVTVHHDVGPGHAPCHLRGFAVKCRAVPRIYHGYE